MEGLREVCCLPGSQVARESFGLIALSEPQIDGGAGLVSFRLVNIPWNPDPLLKPAWGGQRS